MKKHAIIPIFIPHRGCRHDCVFCNQREITARDDDVTPEGARATIDEWLSTLRASEAGGPAERAHGAAEQSVAAHNRDAETVEVAFYGGSFTGIPIEEQNGFLDVAMEYKEAGRIDKIHLSTRPDYISRCILDNLKAHSVDTIELGVQSFDDAVLRLAGRGHDVRCVYEACDLINEYGFELGIQLMIGLPGDSLESCIGSARKAAAIGPELARLYPVVVLRDTALWGMAERGEFVPLSEEEMVERTAEMYKILDDAGITIMRVGLKSTDIISSDGDANSVVYGQTYHPAFRQLVEGRIARERILKSLDDYVVTTKQSDGSNDRPAVTIFSNSRWFSAMIGHYAENRKFFAERFPSISISYSTDNDLPDGRFFIKQLT